MGNYMDTSLQIKSLELLSIGTIKEVLSNPMEIFSIAFQKRAVKLILIHNHPVRLVTYKNKMKINYFYILAQLIFLKLKSKCR